MNIMINGSDVLLVDEYGIIVGIDHLGSRVMLGDRVFLEADTNGYIDTSINKGGWGKIVDFETENTDHYYGVIMNETGEYGHVKHARISKVVHDTAPKRS